jgi:hypothetical protein
MVGVGQGCFVSGLTTETLLAEEKRKGQTELPARPRHLRQLFVVTSLPVGRLGVGLLLDSVQIFVQPIQKEGNEL